VGGSCSMHETDEKCIHNCDQKPVGKRPLGSCAGCRQEDNMNWKQCVRLWVGFFCFRIWTSGGLLWT
jgi:hypothetical protein